MFRIIITKKAQVETPELVDMFRKGYHHASGKKGFANPDIIVEKGK